MTYEKSLDLVLERNAALCLDNTEDVAVLKTELLALAPRGINDWAAAVHETAIEKGWWRKQAKVAADGITIELDAEGVLDAVPTVLTLIHSEISEASEEARSDHWETYGIDPDLLDEALVNCKPEGVGIELVDAVIRIFDLLSALGYDTEKLMELKTRFNANREYRHGGKRY